MRNIEIPFYRQLSADLIKETGINVGRFTLTYSASGESHTLLTKDTTLSNAVYVYDDRGWNISDEGMIASGSIQIENPAILYGPGGLAARGAKISVAAICVSKESNITSVFNVGEIKNTKTAQSIELRIPLQAGIFRDSITVRVVLFLKNNVRSSPGFASKSGTLLGTISETKFVFDESNQMFPIVEMEADKEKPLWWVHCRWTDILNDTFTKDNIAIVLNKNNEYYNMINPESESFSPPYFAETMSGALQLIIERASQQSDEWAEVMNNTNLIEGTIAYVLAYMIDTFGLDATSPENLSATIRKHMYREIK